jgi:hypothetical protein
MFQQHHCDHISDDLQKMTPSRILPSSPPPWWPGGKRSRPAAPRLREKPSFIEGVGRAPLPSAFGSDHRSTAASSPATRSHREQLHLHRGPTPMGISPYSTWVKQKKARSSTIASPIYSGALLRPTPTDYPDGEGHGAARPTEVDPQLL